MLQAAILDKLVDLLAALCHAHHAHSDSLLTATWMACFTPQPRLIPPKYAYILAPGVCEYSHYIDRGGGAKVRIHISNSMGAAMITQLTPQQLLLCK